MFVYDDLLWGLWGGPPVEPQAVTPTKIPTSRRLVVMGRTFGPTGRLKAPLQTEVTVTTLIYE